MKTRIKGVIIVLILGTSFLFGSTEGYPEFYKIYKSNKDVVAFDIPTFFVRLFLPEEEKKDMRPFLKMTDDFKIFVAEESAYHLLPTLNESLHKASYNDALIVNDEGEIITFKIKGNEDMITEIILIVDQMDSFVVVSIMGEFTKEDMREFISSMDTKNVKSTD